jgi:hypothetical protein
MNGNLDFWKDDARGGRPRAVRELARAESRAYRSLLSTLDAERRHRMDCLADRDLLLEEADVESLLEGEAEAKELLADLEAMDEAAKAWQTAMFELHAAISERLEERRSEAPRPSRRKAASSPRRVDKSVEQRPLCEADDDYWYL